MREGFNIHREGFCIGWDGEQIVWEIGPRLFYRQIKETEDPRDVFLGILKNLIEEGNVLLEPDKGRPPRHGVEVLPEEYQ